MCEALKYFNILKYKLGKKILKWKIGGKNYDQGGLSFCVLFFIIFYPFIKKTHSPPSRGGECYSSKYTLLYFSEHCKKF